MAYEIGWNDLLIEKGTLDPLALWRVGDRMISGLLGPFTTVVNNRPARYLSMYCWIINFLNSYQGINDKKAYWKRFFELEAFLLCAIQLHKEHSYEHFAGQIGSEAALKLISEAKDNTINLTKFEKISNGWEANYKGSMEQFNLTELDYGIPSGLGLTVLGKKLAWAYMNSIKNTRFYHSFKSKSEVPIEVVKELAPHSCPCLLHSPQMPCLIEEREICVNYLLKQNLFLPVNKIEEKYLWHSIFIFIDFLKTLKGFGEKLSLITWRRVLSTNLYAENKSYSPAEEHLEVFKKWQVYNIDSLFVFALESSLNGFLEMLHKNGGEINKSELFAASFREAFRAIKKSMLNNNIEPFSDLVESSINNFESIPPIEQLQLEAFLVDMVQRKNDKHKLVCSFLLYLYVQSVFNKLRSNPAYSEALIFYKGRSHRDGYELSLFHTSSDIDNSPKKLEEFFYTYFLSELIINRQLNTRNDRGKEQAWFSYINETKTYVWESDYKPNLYRAARINILMTFLLSLGIVSFKDQGSVPDLELMSELGL